MSEQLYLFYDRISSLLKSTRELDGTAIDDLADTLEISPDRLRDLELGKYPRTEDEEILIRAYVNNYLD